MFNNAITVINQGGAVVWILLLGSLLALTIILFKASQLWQQRIRPGASDQALAYLAEGKRSQALLLLHGQRCPRAKLLAAALDLLDEDRLTSTEQKDEVVRLARLQLSSQAQGLRALEVIAALAPLLGLFGTVLGMIEAFQALEAAGTQVNPAVLSGGIWVALLTTAVGLAVAMPVTLCHSAFERRQEVLAATLQNDIEQLFTLVARNSFESSGHKARLA